MASHRKHKSNFAAITNARMPVGYLPEPREFGMGDPRQVRNQKIHKGIVPRVVFVDDISTHSKAIRNNNNLDNQNVETAPPMIVERQIRPIGMMPVTSSKFNRF